MNVKQQEIHKTLRVAEKGVMLGQPFNIPFIFWLLALLTLEVKLSSEVYSCKKKKNLPQNALNSNFLYIRITHFYVGENQSGKRQVNYNNTNLSDVINISYQSRMICNLIIENDLRAYPNWTKTYLITLFIWHLKEFAHKVNKIVLDLDLMTINYGNIFRLEDKFCISKMINLRSS